MFVQRITVVSHNRPGVLAEVTELLASNGISISSIVAEAYGTDGVIHIDLDEKDVDEALAALTAAGYHAVTEDVLLARIEDRPGALAQLSRRLSEASLDVRGLNMVQRDDGWAVVAIATSDNTRARKVLANDAI
jgi:histidine decarboxylase